MATTGLTAGLSWAAIILPLFPAGIILFRRNWQTGITGCILVLCLLFSGEHIILDFQHITKHDATLLSGIANLIFWSLLWYILKVEANQRWMKDVLNFFLVSFPSVAITIYLLEGPEQYSSVLSTVEEVS